MNYPYLQNIPDGKIKSLNGLRFIMIMFIVLTHINYLEEFFPNYFLGRGAAFGVDYFFMLSGFGMMLSAIKKTFPENTRITPGTCINYAVSHIKKIYPLYLLTTFCLIPIYIYSSIKIGKSVATMMLHLFVKLAFCIPLLQGLIPCNQIQWAFNSVAWFLSCLFIIQIAAPVFIKLFKSIRKTSALVLLLVFCICMISLTAVVFKKIGERTFLNELVYGSPYRRIFYVLTGMVLCLLRFRIPQNKYAGKTWLFNLAETIISLAALFYLFVGRKELNCKIYTINAIIAALIIFTFSFDKGIISRLLSTLPMQTLGAAAMYIFLVHFPIILYSVPIFKRLFTMTSWLAVAEAFFILLSTATGIFIVWKYNKKHTKSFHPHS